MTHDVSIRFTTVKSGTFTVQNYVHPLHEPGYVTNCVGNLTEEKLCVRASEFATRVLMPDVCLKQNIATF
jgi:hypothetical protein